MAVTVYKPFYLNPTTGFPTAIPDGAIINISGTSLNTFTIAGKAVMLADGTAADGGMNLGLFSLQSAYDNSLNIDGDAVIQLTEGKDLNVVGIDGLSSLFKVNAITGAVTISGDLVVGGSSVTVETTVIDADHYLLSPKSPNTTALTITPDAGVSLLAPLIDVKAVNGGPSVMTLSNDGLLSLLYDLTLSGNLNVTGSINGVNIVTTNTNISQHISVSADKHQAKEINIWPGSLDSFTFYQPLTKELQQVVVAISTTLETARSDITVVSGTIGAIDGRVAALEAVVHPVGYTHLQPVASVTWTILHNKNSTNFVYHLFDENGYQVIPDQFFIVSPNEIRATFALAQAGQVNLLFYTV